MYEMKMNNLLVDVKIFSLSRKETLYFELSLNIAIGNRGPLFSQINFDQTYFGGFWHRGFLSRGFCPGVYVLEL